MGSITYNGVSSESLGLKVWTFPSYTFPEKEVTKVHIPGRNGDIVIDNGTYKNVTKTYQLSLYDKTKSYTEMANTISNWLHSSSGYAELSDSYEPNYYRLACYVEGNDISNALNQAAVVTIEFNCKPQRFLSGVNEPTYTSSAVLENPTNYYARPVITVIGNGTAYVNGYKMTISGSSTSLIVDSDMQDAYYYSGNPRTVHNGNNLISLQSGFPVLKPGNNTITIGSGITSVKVVPKWWTL